MDFMGAPDEVLAIPTGRGAHTRAGTAMSEPVLGYRCWLVEPDCDGYRLRGMMVGARWASTPGAWTGAVCSAQIQWAAPLTWHDHMSVPHPDCTCGLHAYHRLDIGSYDAGVEQADRAGVGLVWGAVVGAGKVLTYPRGWRAQLARPVAILQGSGSAGHVCGVAEQLGIPAVRSSDIERVAAEYGHARSPVQPALARY